MLKRIIPVLIVFATACSKEQPPPSPPPQSATPPTTAPAPAEPAPAPATMPAPPAAPTSPAPTSGGGNVAKGEDVYNKTCVACHAAGVAGAPKLGDKANWGPRIAQGNDTLYTHALKGFQGKAGVMPPKGGNMALSDADVKAAVDYMVSKSR